MSIRKRLEKALAGEPITEPVYAAYQYFVENRDLDWQGLFEKGLGQLNHASLIERDRPNVDIVATETIIDGKVRRDVKWVTDIGELHEWFLDNWRQEYLIKQLQDYKIMAHALADTKVTATDEYFNASEEKLGERGITFGQFGMVPESRTPFQRIQVDFAGLERFSLDIAYQLPELLELIEMMNDQLIKEFECILSTPAKLIKLWENITIETMGPVLYRKHLVPVYKRIFEVLEGSDKKIVVHYDGKLNLVADDIGQLPFDGIDSLTPPPEGDIEIADARRLWPDKFLWICPSMSWFVLPQDQLIEKIRQTAKDAGPSRYCMMISEDVPPDWQRNLPLVLQALNGL